jgi:hypothetical protein
MDCDTDDIYCVCCCHLIVNVYRRKRAKDKFMPDKYIKVCSYLTQEQVTELHGYLASLLSDLVKEHTSTPLLVNTSQCKTVEVTLLGSYINMFHCSDVTQMTSEVASLVEQHKSDIQSMGLVPINKDPRKCMWFTTYGQNLPVLLAKTTGDTPQLMWISISTIYTPKNNKIIQTYMKKVKTCVEAIPIRPVRPKSPPPSLTLHTPVQTPVPVPLPLPVPPTIPLSMASPDASNSTTSQTEDEHLEDGEIKEEVQEIEMQHQDTTTPAPAPTTNTQLLEMFQFGFRSTCAHKGCGKHGKWLAIEGLDELRAKNPSKSDASKAANMFRVCCDHIGDYMGCYGLVPLRKKTTGQPTQLIKGHGSVECICCLVTLVEKPHKGNRNGNFAYKTCAKCMFQAQKLFSFRDHNFRFTAFFDILVTLLKEIVSPLERVCHSRNFLSTKVLEEKAVYQSYQVTTTDSWVRLVFILDDDELSLDQYVHHMQKLQEARSQEQAITLMFVYLTRDQYDARGSVKVGDHKVVVSDDKPQNLNVRSLFYQLVSLRQWILFGLCSTNKHTHPKPRVITMGAAQSAAVQHPLLESDYKFGKLQYILRGAFAEHEFEQIWRSLDQRKKINRGKYLDPELFDFYHVNWLTQPINPAHEWLYSVYPNEVENMTPRRKVDESPVVWGQVDVTVPGFLSIEVEGQRDPLSPSM